MSFNPLSWIAHQIDSNYEPSYALLQKRLRDEALGMQLVSMVGLAASAVGLLFGLPQNTIPNAVISGAIGYVSYNMYRVGENYYKVAENPNNFDSMFGWSDIFGKRKQDNPKLKKCLQENTFYFGAFVDFVVKHVVNLKN
jgi:hypothetical protein